MKIWRVLFINLMLWQCLHGAKKCIYEYYKIQGTSRCEFCNVTCSPMQGLVRNCGFNEEGQKVRDSCQICPDGEHSFLKEHGERGAIRRCKYCTPCKERLNREFKSPCRRTSNSECGECLPGFYSEGNLDACLPITKKSRAGPVIKTQPKKEKAEPTNATKYLQTRLPTRLRTVKRKLSTILATKSTKKYSVLWKSFSNPQILNKTKRFTDLPAKTFQQSTHINHKKSSTVPKIHTTMIASPIYKRLFKKSTPTLIGENSTTTKIEVTEISSSHSKDTPKTRNANEKALSSNSPAIFYTPIWFTFIIVLAFIVLAFLILTTCKWRKFMKNKKGSSLSSSPRTVSESSFNRLSKLEETLQRTKADDASVSTTVYLEDHVIEMSTEDLINKAIPFSPDEEKTENDTAMSCNSIVLASIPCANKRPLEAEMLLRKEPIAIIKKKHYERHHSVEGQVCTNPHFCCRYSATRNCSRKMESLKVCQTKLLKMYLDVESPGVANWKEVATYFGVDQRVIELWEANFKAGSSPTVAVLRFLSAKRKSISEFVKCLEDLTRFDVSDSFLTHLEQGCVVCS